MTGHLLRSQSSSVHFVLPNYSSLGAPFLPCSPKSTGEWWWWLTSLWSSSMCSGEHASSLQPFLELEDDRVSLMQPQQAWGLTSLQPPRLAVLRSPTQGSCMGRGAVRKPEVMVTQIMEDDSGWKKKKTAHGKTYKLWNKKIFQWKM